MRVNTSFFKFRAGDAALADDGKEGADLDFAIIWDGYRLCCSCASALHDHVASASPYFNEAMTFEDAADFLS